MKYGWILRKDCPFRNQKGFQYQSFCKEDNIWTIDERGNQIPMCMGLEHCPLARKGIPITEYRSADWIKENSDYDQRRT